MNIRSRSRRVMATAMVAGSLALAGSITLPAEAASNNNTSKKLRQAVTLAGLEEHLAAFQKIADANGGTRFSGTPGYDASVAYAKKVFEAAGYSVTVQPFDYLASEIVGPATLQQTAPNQVTYKEDVDYTYLSQTDPGDVTAPVQAVDLALGLGNKSTSGCEAADFAGFTAGNIALIQRGTCPFEQKIENAAAAGAVGVVFFNQGDTTDPSRTGLAAITLGATNTSGIPALLATYARGVEWSETPGLTMRIVTDTVREMKPTSNVIAESRWGDPNSVVMAGAHLDSVLDGPGINDNGTGSAAILEVAEQMQKVHTKDRVRFALWGAEESGLVGSTHYVNSLSDDALDKIELYLNFDMIGSPNFVRFVYDGDNSEFPANPPNIAKGPEGSGEIEQVFHNYFAGQGLPSAESGFTGRSDYGPFIAEGIPSGGLFTGAEGIKTAEEAAIFGGTAGVAYDKCYHQACDDLSNVNRTGFHQMADAVAHSVLTFAMDGRPVSPPGREVVGVPTTAEPSGGHEHDHGEVE